MRLAYIQNYYIPSRTANTVHAMKMCQAFVQEGYTPSLFGIRAPDLAQDTGMIFYHYGIRTPFELVLLRAHPFWRGHDFAVRTTQIIRQRRLPLVYSRGLLAAMWTALRGLPTIYEEHQPPGTRLGQYYLGVLLRQKTFVKLVVITEALKHIYLEHYGRILKPEKVIVEPDAVDLERFENLPDVPSTRQVLRLPQDGFIAGYAGSLYRGRGIELLLELARRLPEVVFTIAGGTENDLAHWRSFLKENPLANVHLMGFIANAELPSYLAACDVLLMPYQRHIAVVGTTRTTDAWMSPMKLFEYMAAERPIIASDFPVLRSVLSAANAILCEPENTEGWEQALRQIMAQPAWAEQLAKQARRDVERYTWRGRIRRIMAQVDE